MTFRGLGPRPPRAALLAGAIALLGLAGWGGLVRIGWEWPVPGSASVADHGAIVVTGFVATLVATIRAVTSLRPRWLVVPGLSLAAAVLLAADAPAPPAAALALAGALGLLAMGILAPPPGAPTALLPVVAAACLAVGDALWMLTDRPSILWWASFALFAIAGQRLDVDPRLLGRAATRWALRVAAALMVAGAAASAAALDGAMASAGAGFVVLAGWGVASDAIPKVRAARVAFARFAASAMLSAYALLALGGVLAIAFAGPPGSARYDAIVHAVFAGAVLSAVFGHFATYVPGVLGLTIRPNGASYGALALLDVAVVARVLGDVAGAADAVRVASLVIGVAVALFLATAATQLRPRGRPRKAASTMRASSDS